MPPRLPALVLAVAAAAAAPGQSPTPPDKPAAHKDLAYGPHERNRLDLYLPKTAGPAPVVLWVHGGGWEAGDKADPPGLALLGKGYAVASTNYRFSTTAPLPAQIADVRAAVRFLKANAAKYHLDPDHVGAWGASAGGHLVALLAVGADIPELDGDRKPAAGAPSPSVRCVIDLFGPTDFATIVPADQAGGPVGRLLGGSSGQKKELARLGSPVSHVSKAAAPCLILHGTDDKLVPLSQSEVFADRLRRAGADVELVVLPGAGHGGKEFSTPANLLKVAGFFDKHLKGK